MTGPISKPIMADSITGMIFAAEGIRNAVVLLNGPMGCKFYHSTTSQFLSIRPLLHLPSEDGQKAPVDYHCLNDWFFRQPRVPCTFLDGYDYVYGTSERVEEGLRYLRSSVAFELLVIVNSPGASLIGDHLKELAKRVLPDRPCVLLESPGYSRDFWTGYGEAALELVKQAGRAPGETDRGTRSHTVNVLGLSIWNRYWEGDREELTRLLGLCGIHVNCFLCAGCSFEELCRLPEADLNLVIDPQAGAACAEYLHEVWGMDSLVCPALPVGFDASERLCRALCEYFHTDPAAWMEDAGRARALAWYRLNDLDQMCGLPKGVPFAVEGSACQVLAYSRFFTEYLGMLPECLSIVGTADEAMDRRLRQWIREQEAGEAREREIMDSRAELVFGDANTIAALKTTGRVFCGIEISLPGMGYTDLIPKTQLGIRGALFLIEQVINGLMSKL